MGITDKLTYLKTTKQKIMEALLEKGCEISDDLPFRKYADEISNIHSVKPLTSENPYERPDDWMPEPKIYIDEHVIYLLYAVYNRANPAAFSIGGTNENFSFCVQIGNGAKTEVNGGISCEYQFNLDYESLPESSLTSNGYKTVWVKVISEQPILLFGLQTLGEEQSKGTSSNILQMMINAPELVNLQLGGDPGNPNLKHDHLQFCSIWSHSITDMSYLFGNCSALVSIPQLKTPNITDTRYMFYGCSTLSVIPQIDTSKVTNMSYMFYNCSGLTEIPLLDTNNVTDMRYIFYGCSKLTTIPQLDTAKVINMSYMFYDCSSLTEIPLLATNNVGDMHSMFSKCSLLKTIPQLNTAKVSDMRSMFYECRSMTAVPLLNTSVVRDMGFMFQFCTKLSNIPQFVTSNVTDMTATFSTCGITSLPLLDTTKVTNMNSMFVNSKLSVIPEINVTNVKYMNSMFMNCSKLTEINMKNISVDVNVSPCVNLGRSAIVKLFGNLKQVNPTKKITLPSGGKAQLTSSDLAIATNKGWTVA